MKTFQGIGASPGTAIGLAYLYRHEDLIYKSYLVEDSQAEWARMGDALNIAETQLREIHARALESMSESQAMIFEAQMQMLSDPELLAAIQTSIIEQKNNSETALMQSAEHYAGIIEAMDDEYFRARAADIRDIVRRCLRILLGKPQLEITLHQPSIVVARDLTPSDSVRMDKSRLLGFCTAEGGSTSHTAILAKALGIPAVVGAGTDILTLSDGETLIIQGRSGRVIASPDELTLHSFEQVQRAEQDRAALDLISASQPAITVDGVQVEVVANIGSVQDANNAIQFGAEGIGLLRTEFLYLDRQTEPDEEEQFQAYRSIFNVMGSRPVVIRTLDVGGDKNLPYIDLGREDNPFLGWRAIRMCLDNPKFFKNQLRAILRASTGHDVRIMFPMIATVSELKKARTLLDEARAELRAVGKPFGEQIQVGIMVEVPAAAIMADQFAKVVDFFSIGTNDLTQYTLAVERTNKKVAYLSNALDPAVLRLISMVIEEGHKGGIWVGMCGELAGEPKAIPVLLGLGLDEFSMAPALISHAKSLIRASDMATCRQIAADVLNLSSYAEVDEYLSHL